MTDLSVVEREWLARHWVDTNEFASDTPPPDSLAKKLHLFFKRADGMNHYELVSDYDTQENHAWIEATKRGLGL